MSTPKLNPHPGIKHLAATRRFPKTTSNPLGGGWLVRWRGPDGEHHRQTFATKKDAIGFQEATRTDIRRGIYKDDRRGRIPLADVAEEWFASAQGTLRPKTSAGYRGILDTHVLPEFGRRGIGSITPGQVKAILASRGVSTATRRNILRVLSQVMKHALDDGLIQSNPCQGVKTGAIERREMLFLTSAEVQALAQAIAPEFRTLVLVAAYTGMRQGELMALRVKRVDLLHSSITVAESVADIGGELHYGPTKSNRIRTIGITPSLVTLLTQQVAGKRPNDLVFSHPNGEAMKHGDYYRKHFKQAVRAALPPEKQGLRFHDLRHTHVALLIDQNVHAKAISNRLGHSSIAITMDRYGHLMDDHEESILEGMEARYQEAAAANARVVPIKKRKAR
jgi:integrase